MKVGEFKKLFEKIPDDLDVEVISDEHAVFEITGLNNQTTPFPTVAVINVKQVGEVGI